MLALIVLAGSRRAGRRPGTCRTSARSPTRTRVRDYGTTATAGCTTSEFGLRLYEAGHGRAEVRAGRRRWRRLVKPAEMAQDYGEVARRNDAGSSPRPLVLWVHRVVWLAVAVMLLNLLPAFSRWTPAGCCTRCCGGGPTRPRPRPPRPTPGTWWRPSACWCQLRHERGRPAHARSWWSPWWRTCKLAALDVRGRAGSATSRQGYTERSTPDDPPARRRRNARHCLSAG